MIDLDVLKKVARTKGLQNTGYAEKDYFQEILLLGISREAPELVFKGGTSLYKLNGLDRFSEVLDFSGGITDREIDRIGSYLKDFGYNTEVKIKRQKRGALITFITEGFLYRGTTESLTRVQMDVNTGDVHLDTEWAQFFSLYPDIPSFRIQSMALEEILAEKVRTLVVRNKARDAYDIWFLLNKGVMADRSLVNKKLELYELSLEPQSIKKEFEKYRKIWDRELRVLMPEVPDFEMVRIEIQKKLNTMF